jgi:hypothetical protein
MMALWTGGTVSAKVEFDFSGGEELCASCGSES